MLKIGFKVGFDQIQTPQTTLICGLRGDFLKNNL